MAMSQVAALAFNSAGTLLASGSLDSKHIISPFDRPTCGTADPEPCMQYISHCGTADPEPCLQCISHWSIAVPNLLGMTCRIQQ